MNKRIHNALSAIDRLTPDAEVWENAASSNLLSFRSEPARSKRVAAIVVGACASVIGVVVLLQFVPSGASDGRSLGGASSGTASPSTEARRTPSPPPVAVGAVATLDSGDGWTFTAQNSDQGLTVTFSTDTGMSDRPYVRMYAPTCAFGQMTIGSGASAHVVVWGVAVSEVAKVILDLDSGKQVVSQTHPIPAAVDGNGYGWTVFPLDSGTEATGLVGLRFDGSQVPASECSLDGSG